MNPWIAIIIIAGTTGLVAYLTTRRGGRKVTITHTTTPSEDSEK